uniref:Uncharacterized protein n=1 Tax=viral metagenome TaxID=1070528 RepID=A0A6C0D6J4_9ZZZZ
MKKYKHSKKNLRGKKRRVTKRMRGGFLGNLFGNFFAKDENNEDTKYYYTTTINVKDKKYKINYFTPNNFLLFKNTDQIMTPKFFIYLDENEQASDVISDVIMKIGNYIVNSIVKIENNGKYNWYVITRTLENLTNFTIKPGYYKIKPKILYNDGEKLHIKKNNYTNISNTVTMNKSTYTPLKDGDDAINVLVNFDIQQTGKEAIKDEGVNVIGDEIFN